MLEASDCRLVLRWTCKVCGNVNYLDGTNGAASKAALKEAAEDLDLSPEDLALVPDKLFCQKCEEVHSLPEDFGIQEDDV
jgi:hypothetical protein